MVAQPIPGLEGYEPDWSAAASAAVDLRTWAKRVAQQRGVPEDVLLGVLGHESGLDPKAYGNGGGVGQFIESTARSYGTTQAELRANPRKAVELAAQLLRDNAAQFGGDYDKAAAAYFIGPDNINKATAQGGSGWLAVADQLARQYNQGTVSGYLSSVHGGAGSEAGTGIPADYSAPSGAITGGSVMRAMLGDLPGEPRKSVSDMLADARDQREQELERLTQVAPLADVSGQTFGDLPQAPEDVALRSAGKLRTQLPAQREDYLTRNALPALGLGLTAGVGGPLAAESIAASGMANAIGLPYLADKVANTPSLLEPLPEQPRIRPPNTGDAGLAMLGDQPTDQDTGTGYAPQPDYYHPEAPVPFSPTGAVLGGAFKPEEPDTNPDATAGFLGRALSAPSILDPSQGGAQYTPEGEQYVDPAARATLRGELEARRQGGTKSPLGRIPEEVAKRPLQYAELAALGLAAQPEALGLAGAGRGAVYGGVERAATQLGRLPALGRPLAYGFRMLPGLAEAGAVGKVITRPYETALQAIPGYDGLPDWAKAIVETAPYTVFGKQRLATKFVQTIAGGLGQVGGGEGQQALESATGVHVPDVPGLGPPGPLIGGLAAGAGAGALETAARPAWQRAAVALATNERFAARAPGFIAARERAGANWAQEQAGQAPVEARGLARLGAMEPIGGAAEPSRQEARRYGAQMAQEGLQGTTAQERRYGAQVRSQYVARFGEEGAARQESGFPRSGLNWATYGDAMHVFEPDVPSWMRPPAEPPTGETPAEAVRRVREQRAGTDARSQMERAQAALRGEQPPPVAGAAEPSPQEARRYGARAAQEGMLPGDQNPVQPEDVAFGNRAAAAVARMRTVGTTRDSRLPLEMRGVRVLEDSALQRLYRETTDQLDREPSPGNQLRLDNLRQQYEGELTRRGLEPRGSRRVAGASEPSPSEARKFGAQMGQEGRVPLTPAQERRAAAAEERRAQAEERRRVAALPPAVREGTTTWAQMVDNAEKILREGGGVGRTWYPRVGQHLLQLSHQNPGEAARRAGMLAMGSPQNPVKNQGFQLLKGIGQRLRGEPMAIHTETQNRRAEIMANGTPQEADDLIIQMLKEPLTTAQRREGRTRGLTDEQMAYGRKTANFFLAMLRHIDPERYDALVARAKAEGARPGVTVDMHVQSIFGFDPKKSITDRQYSTIEQGVQDVADRMGWDYDETQAAFFTADIIRSPGARVNMTPERAAEDYADALRDYEAVITWETAPGNGTPASEALAGFPNWSYPDKLAFHADAKAAVIDPVTGVNKIAEAVGLPGGESREQVGFYEGGVNPGVASSTYLGPDLYALADETAALMGYATQQTAVPWTRRVLRARTGEHNGLFLQMHRPMTPEEMLLLGDNLGPGFVVMQASDNRAIVFRLKGKDDFTAQTADSNSPEFKALGKRNKAGHRSILKVADEVLGDDLTLAPTSAAFDGGYLENDWTVHPNGEAYLDKAPSYGRGHERSAVVRPVVDQARADYTDAARQHAALHRGEPLPGERDPRYNYSTLQLNSGLVARQRGVFGAGGGKAWVDPEGRLWKVKAPSHAQAMRPEAFGHDRFVQEGPAFRSVMPDGWVRVDSFKSDPAPGATREVALVGMGDEHLRRAGDAIVKSLPESAYESTFLNFGDDASGQGWHGYIDEWLAAQKPVTGGQPRFADRAPGQGASDAAPGGVTGEVGFDAMGRPLVAGASEPAPEEARRFGAQMAQEGRIPGGRDRSARATRAFAEQQAAAAAAAQQQTEAQNAARAGAAQAGQRAGAFEGNIPPPSAARALGRQRDRAATQAVVTEINAPPPEPPVEPSGGGGIGANAMALASSAISSKSMLSPPWGRQGWANFFRSPKESLRILLRSHKDAYSRASFDETQQNLAQDDWVKDTTDLRAPTTAGPLNEQQRAQGQTPYKGMTWLDAGGTLNDPYAASRLEQLSIPELRGIAQDAGLGVSDKLSKRDLVERLAREVKPDQLQAYTNTRVGRAFEIIGRPSERQTASEQNQERITWYKEQAQNLYDQGERDPQAYVNLRKMVEQWTQRGSWAQPGKFPVLMSTRALSGRVEAVANGLLAMVRHPRDVFLPGGKAGASREHGRALVRSVVGNMITYGGMYAAAYAAGLDPDFEMDGKLPVLKIGSHRVDLWAGLNAPAKALVGTVFDTIDAVKQEGVGLDAAQLSAQAAFNRGRTFARGNLNPFIGKLADIFSGRDYTGKKYSLSEDVKSGGIITSTYAPFVAEGIIDGVKEGGGLTPKGAAEGAAVAVPSYLSMGVNSYTTSSDQADQLSQKYYPGRGFDDLSKVEQARVISDMDDADAQKQVKAQYNQGLKSRKSDAGFDNPSADSSDLYRQNPELDAQNAVLNHDPVHSLEAADLVLQTGHQDAVLLPGFKRQINQNADTRKAWDYSKAPVDWFLAEAVPANAPSAIEYLSRQKDAGNYRRPDGSLKTLAELGATEHGKVTSMVNEKLLDSDPELHAWLVYWGARQAPKQPDAKLRRELNKISAQYSWDESRFMPAVVAGVKATATMGAR